MTQENQQPGIWAKIGFVAFIILAPILTSPALTSFRGTPDDKPRYPLPEQMIAVGAKDAFQKACLGKAQIKGILSELDLNDIRFQDVQISHQSGEVFFEVIVNSGRAKFTCHDKAAQYNYRDSGSWNPVLKE